MADFTWANNFSNDIPFKMKTNNSKTLSVTGIKVSCGRDREWSGAIAPSALYPKSISIAVSYTYKNTSSSSKIQRISVTYYRAGYNGRTESCGTKSQSLYAQAKTTATGEITLTLGEDDVDARRAYYYGSTTDALPQIIISAGWGDNQTYTIDPADCVFEEPTINTGYWKLLPCSIWRGTTKTNQLTVSPTSDLSSYSFVPQNSYFVADQGNVLEFYFSDDEGSSLNKTPSSPTKSDIFASYAEVASNGEYPFTSDVETKLCEKVMKQQEKKNQYIFHLEQWQRITIKNGTFPEGTYVLLPGGKVAAATKSTSGNLVNELFFVIQGIELIVKPSRTPNTMTIESASIVDPHNIGVLHTGGCKVALKMRVNLSWDVKKATLKIPTDCGLYRVKDIKIEKTAATNFSQVYDLSMPQNYPDGFVKENKTEEAITGVVILTTDKGDEIRKSFYYTDGLKLDQPIVYKFFPLDFKEFTAYRCDENGQANSEGNFISVLPVFTYATLGSKNKLTAHLSITKLRDKTKLFDEDITVTSGQPFLVSGSAADKETSYYCSLTLSDSFNSTTKAYNVGTIETYFEVGSGESQVSVGKYCEVEKGFEVQFPSYFYRQVAFLNNAKNMSDAARVIDYTDNEKIGATNIQGALDWILARLS